MINIYKSFIYGHYGRWPINKEQILICHNNIGKQKEKANNMCADCFSSSLETSTSEQDMQR